MYVWGWKKLQWEKKKTEWLESEYLNNEKGQRDIARKKTKINSLKRKKSCKSYILWFYISP